MNEPVTATAAQEKVTVTRNEVKKEGRLLKMLAMLASTILIVKTTVREDVRTGQINIPANNNVDYAANIITPNRDRTSLTLRNTGSNDVYIGSYGVTTTTGFLLKNTDQPFVLKNTWGALYAISVSGSTISYIEE
jgi:hypothetical protein